MTDSTLGIGVIGCGGFGHFALQHFTQVPGIQLVGMAGTHRDAAFSAAKRFGIPDPVDVEELVTWDNIDVVYIATPPFLHFPQAMAALKAGKHVICEKPFALNLEEADAMIAAANEGRLCVVANLMQRYNPMFERVRQLIQSEVLGKVIHGYFENYATDEGLPPDHWFWDHDKAGGIFIEHGVHFFDLFEGWLGPGSVASAQVSVRPGSKIEEQVQCAVRYADGVVINFYHGFTQAGRMDRQEFRLLFERGDLTLYEWVPTVARIRAIADETNTAQLMEIFPGARLDITESYPPRERHCAARHKELDVYQKLELNYGLGEAKMHLYGELLRAMFTDQTAWIRDPSHRRTITDVNGRDSLAMAVEADRVAHAVAVEA